MALNTSYVKYVSKVASYTLDVTDDVAKFVIAAPATATLPLAANCTAVSGQNFKIISNDSTSSGALTIAVQSGNTLVGEGTPTGPAQTIAAGETAYLQGNEATIWWMSGGSGTVGVSGFSGFSGASGFSGFSGYSGYSGVSGASGYSGKSGWSGFSGYSGFSGPSGYSGFSGKSGYSGFSGYSGYSGFSV